MQERVSTRESLQSKYTELQAVAGLSWQNSDTMRTYVEYRLISARGQEKDGFLSQEIKNHIKFVFANSREKTICKKGEKIQALISRSNNALISSRLNK